MDAPPNPNPRKDSWIVKILARLLILGDKLGPFKKVILWVTALILVLVLLGTIPRIARNRRLASEARAEINSIPSVTVTSLERSPANLLLTLPGNVEAIEQTQLNARTTGYVQRYLVDIGDRVRTGQVLAVIDTPEVDQQAQQAQAELARAQATLAQSTAQLAQQGAALLTARANAAKANADLGRVGQTAQQQRAQLREARANAELARVTWQRWHSLVAGGAISAQEADEKEAAYNAAIANVSSLEAALRAGNADVQSFKAALKAAQADVSAAGENVTAYRAAVNAARAGVAAANSNVRRFSVLSGFRDVRAPYDGVITARSIQSGGLVSSGGTASSSSGVDSSSGASTSLSAPTSGTQRTGNSGLFTLARIDDLRIYIDVPQNDASNISVGQNAEVTIRELPGQRFLGRVNRTSRSLDQNTRTLRTEIVLFNRNGVLLPGMYASVKLKVLRQNPPILVPSSALISDARGNQIAVVKDDKIAFRKVEIGRDYGESLEVVEGAKAGEKVVTNPSDELHSGTKVKATLAKPPKKPGGDDAEKSKVGPKGSQGKKSAGAQGDKKVPSLNETAKKQEVKQGGESNEDRALPGGAEREAASKKNKP